MLERSKFYSLSGINLDMALEAHEIIRGETGQEISGVRIEREKYEYAEVTSVHVENELAEKTMGKPIGSYVTIDAPEIRRNNREIQKEIATIIANKSTQMARLNENDTVLLVGLGNWNATPDALGPRVIDFSLVTRHIHNYAPEELSNGLRSVCALAPGVLGTTGIETAEIIRGVVEKVKPNLIICIDALASASVERIASSIQIADTGISPGSGIGNKRAGINEETMGVPVIAIGLPTVVHAAVIAHETLNQFFKELQTSPTLYQIYKGLRPEAVQNIINSVLKPYEGALMVTPKEIDDLIKNSAKIIAGGINQAMHPAINPEDFSEYLN